MKFRILVTYDVSTETREGRRRLRHVAKICLGFGQRVQMSVFECQVTPSQKEDMVRRLLKVMNEAEDSVRVYRLRPDLEDSVEQYGNKRSLDFDEPLII
ncbi:MAG: CRISPR-associated endonuclease Cas2 [Candidatus Sericytochromatia bacterium]|nr:CRISPR-associated endonuclease Cas2 [Candidatus Sericytochromatia bacterium]